MTLSLPSLGWDDRFAARYRRHDRPGCRAARVSWAEPGVCRLLDADGVGRASVGGVLLARAAADPAALPCPGDWVVVQEWPDGRSTLEAVLPRHNLLCLATAGERPVRIANLDTVAVVVAPGGAPTPATVASLRSSGVAGTAPVVEVLGADASGLDRLRALASVGRTVGLVDDSAPTPSRGAAGKAPRRAARSLLSALAGVDLLPARGLLALPGGGTALLVEFTGGPAAAAPLPVVGRADARTVARRRA
jgi:ribosome biogenesis GTPase